MNPARSPFESHPHYTERMRADFELLKAVPDTAMQQRLEAEAQSMLSSVLAIEDAASAKSDEDKEAGPDILRLERKIDLVLQLLSMQLMDGNTAPECQVQLSAAGARWEIPGATLPAPGSQVIAAIHVHRFLPRPLRLLAEVLPDEPGWLCLLFSQHGEVCEELLARHVFQQHRRHLAGSRRAKR